MFNYQGLCSITKRDFFCLFWPAYRRAFSADNIKSGWQKTGIFPYNPDVILLPLQPKLNQQDNDTLSQGTERQPLSQQIQTAELLVKDWRQVRRLYREVVLQKPGPPTAEQELLGDTLLHLTTQIELLQIENDGLRQAIINEKKKRKRGKTLMEEFRAESESQATFFSPTKIKRAQELQKYREQEKQRATTQKQQEKLQRDILRQEKEQEIKHRRQMRIEQKEARALVRAQKQQEQQDKKEAREAERQLQQEAKAVAIARRRPPAQTTGSNRPVVVIEEQVNTGVVEQAVARPSRARRLPKHLEAYEL
jgi:hypothetical protein